MKIFFYITSIERGGGAERVICNLASLFCEAGHECTMITSHPEPDEYELVSGIRRVNLAPSRTNGFFRRNRELYYGLKKLVKKEKPDVLISFMAEPNFRAVAACLGTKTKCIISVRNDPDYEYPTFFHKVLAKVLFRYADFVVFQTNDARNWFPNVIRKKSAVIFNPVGDRFVQEPVALRGNDIVATGRLESQKNHRLLIDAFINISGQTDGKLTIYGEGTLRNELQEYIDRKGFHERILLPGKTSDVISAIKGAGLYVLSSDYEGMPNALMEAMALGLPCISTDCPCGGPRELIENEKNGLLVEIGNISALSSAISYMITNREIAVEMGKQARISAQRFTTETIFGQWCSVVL